MYQLDDLRKRENPGSAEEIARGPNSSRLPGPAGDSSLNFTPPGSAIPLISNTPQGGQDDWHGREKGKRGESALSPREKLGGWAIIVFSVGPILVFAAMGMISFLWFGDATNSAWKFIIQRNWATTTVAICSEVVKQAISFQLGLIVAMLAAAALERFEVLLPEMASFSMMRAIPDAGTTVVMLWHYIASFWHGGFRLTLVFVLALTSSLLFGLTQVVSILLVSDIDMVTIPGPVRHANTSFAFAYYYQNENGSGTVSTSDGFPIPPPPKVKVMSRRGGTWFRKPPIYASFAEYSEPPYEAEGVVDTGRTLRAFLPFQTVQERETLMSYSQSTTVLDARVTCQSPEFIDPRIMMVGTYGSNILIKGSVRALQDTPRIGNASVRYQDTGKSGTDRSAFSCLAALPGPSSSPTVADDEWKISICQLALGTPLAEYTGGLISEFKDASTWWDKTRNTTTMQNSALYGNAYLVFNVTLGHETDLWRAITEQSGEDNGYRPPAYSRRNEWYDMVFDEQRHVLSATLCHTAFDFAHMPVSISSTRNRTEPVPTFDYGRGRFTFGDIRSLLGQDKSRSPSQRGILQLENKASWVANGDENTLSIEPYLRSFADMSLAGNKDNFDKGNTGNASGLIYSRGTCAQGTRDVVAGRAQPARCYEVDPMHIWLFQEILRTGGSVAFALQSAITTISSMAYYDQIGQFDNFTVAEQVFFQTASAPVRRVGFTVVAVAVCLHLALACVVIVSFLTRTSLTRIGDTWSAVAQLSSAGGKTKHYVERSGSWRDDRVEQAMARDGVRSVRAGLVRDEQGEVIAVTSSVSTSNSQDVLHVGRRQAGSGSAYEMLRSNPQMEVTSF